MPGAIAVISWMLVGVFTLIGGVLNGSIVSLCFLMGSYFFFTAVAAFCIHCTVD